MIREPASGARDCVFEVATRTRVFILKARTHGDMVNWIRELRRYTAHEEENDVLDEIQAAIDEV